jgi:hypothetical protein
LDRGLTVELLSGIFTSSFDLKYTEEMIETKSYQTWAGVLGHDVPNKEYHFKGTKSWSEHLVSLFGEKNVLYADGCITLLRPKAMNHTKHHIYAFITAYLRINTLEAIRKIGEENVIGVQMDGIFYKECTFDMPAGFRVKEYKEPVFNEASKWFHDRSDIDDSTWSPLRDERLLSNCVLAGQGGSGKTTMILKKEEGMDSPWNDMIYVVPQHDLGKDKQQELNANYKTTCRIAGIDCVSLADQGRQPASMLLDELTMVDEDIVKKIIELYPNTLIFAAADIEMLPDDRLIWFQCRNGRPDMFSKIWTPPKSWNWITCTTDYRSKDEQLKALKLWLRDRMRANFTDGGPKDSHAMMIDILTNNDLKVLPRKQAVPLFVPGDTWIAGTNQKSSLLLKDGIVSGWVSRTGIDRGRKSFVEVAGWEKRGSFTTHSFQGQTVKKGKVFVSINDAFEHAMIYTAISRATSYDQIVLVS